jgi:dipeptidyl aminopeptidase/acylaminoacyl peptidase
MNAANLATARLSSLTRSIHTAYSPDGSKIALHESRWNNEIYLMSADGSTSMNLTNNSADDQRPTWSPDAAIAFSTNRDGNREIYVMKVMDQLEQPSKIQPTISSCWFKNTPVYFTGRVDCFTSTRDGNQEIYRMKPDGTELGNHQLPTNDYSPVGEPNGHVPFASERDGNWIFTSWIAMARSSRI